MHWIDAHLDLAYLALAGRDLRVPCADPGLGCVSLPALREARAEIVFGTLYTSPRNDDNPCSYPSSDDREAAWVAGQRQLAVYRDFQAGGEITIARCREDLARDTPLPRIVLLMEGADPIRDPGDVGRWFDDGVRIVGLTWAAGTRYAGGNASPGPLSALGRELVSALDEAGIVHDASHLADEAFDDLLGVATGPIVATHSNCRELVADDQRHLGDDQIRAIGDRGGVIGLNLFSRFLTRDGRATIATCIEHLQRISELMGHRRGVGLGSDADGGFSPRQMPKGLEHHRDLAALAEGLRDAGWSDQDIKGFCHGNWLRLLRKALPQTAPAA